MKRRPVLLCVTIGILVILALLVVAGGCSNKATTVSIAVKTSAVTTSSAPPTVITSSTAVPPPPTSSSAPAPAVSKPPPPASDVPPPASSNSPAPAGSQPPPVGTNPPLPAGSFNIPADPLPGSGKMVLTSAAVKDGVIGESYSCVGVNSGAVAAAKSLPLVWTGAPVGTQSFVIILSGIRGGGDEGIMFIVYKIPGTSTGLPEGLKDNLVDPVIGTIGTTDRGVTGYTGPCAGTPGPWLRTVTLYALSATPAVPDDPKSVTAPVLRDAMKNITLDTAILNFNVIIK